MIRWFSNVAITAVIALALGTAAYGQWRGDGDHDRDDDWRAGPYSNRSIDQRAYREGVSQGQYDRSRNFRYNFRTREWRDGDSAYRNAYRSGYDQGYNGYGGYRNGGSYPYPNYPYAGNYPQGRYGNGRYGNPGANAYQQGFRDGRMDGLNDWRTGHSYRPTHDSNYKHADRGYNSYYGDKNGYKQEYRSGYLNGYEQGYRR